MNIRNWPMDQIMQLPDCCFGTRWPVSCGVTSSAVIDQFTIVKTGLPDRCVLWELLVLVKSEMAQLFQVEFAWGDQLPPDLSAWNQLQKMFPCQGVQDASNYYWEGGGHGDLALRRLRMPSPASGQRPCMRVDKTSTAEYMVTAIFVVSSFPTEVPDWLISEYRRSR
ncbi:hypothetical protein ES705_24988 [subsurface metagenome]